MASLIDGSLFLKSSSSNMTMADSWDSLSKGNWSRISLIILSIIVARFVAVWSYNLWFHPLAKFPGPFLGRASLLYRYAYTSRGLYHIATTEAHRKYGPIVRMTPDELSFASVESWKPIYGHPGPGKQIPPKTVYHAIFGSGFSHKCIVSESDAQKHSVVRKTLNPAFSQRSLHDQEDIISSIVNKFIDIIGEKGGSGSEGLNMTKWFEMNAFDLISEISFGESFGSVDNGSLHFWPEGFASRLYLSSVIDDLRRIGWISKAAKFLLPLSLVRRNKYSNFSRQQVEKLLSKPESRNDFASPLIDKVRNGEMDKEEMAAHVSILAMAGSMTVSDTLTAVIYFLAKNPDTLKKLATEIRTTFQSFEDINATTTQQLPYLRALLDETLRLFPSAAFGSPRTSLGFELHGYYIPAGFDINISPWTITHDDKYFSDPYDFKPERWTDPNCTDVKEASRPFFIGPRDCLGRNFAWMEMNLVVSKLIWRYDMELVNKDVDLIQDSKLFLMWEKPDLFFRFHKASC